MDRKERRRATKAAKVGDVIHTATAIGSDGLLYWCRVPDGMTPREAAATQKVYGPFASDKEVSESQRDVLLGPQCKVTEGGAWDPAWDKMQ
jgi:hypothetical protein